MTKQTKTTEDYPELLKFRHFHLSEDYDTCPKDGEVNLSTYDQDVVEQKLLSMQSKIDELTEQNKELKTSAKKAFWWSAEFTHVVHGGKIQQAWEDYKNKLNKESK